MKKIPKYALIIFFLTLVFGISINTICNCYQKVGSILKQCVADRQDSYVSALEKAFVEDLWGKEMLADIAGVSRAFLNLRLTDDGQFYKDEDGIVHLKTKEKTFDPLISSAGYLADSLDKNNTPFLVCQIAERGMYSDRYSGLFDGKSTEYIQPLKEVVEAEGAIYFDYASTLQKLGFQKEDIFFKTDLHYQTQAEFGVLGKIVEALEDNSNMIFTNKELALDLSNYRTEAYPFLGNLGASMGRAYTGEDSFVYYLPNFETSMKIENPSQSLVKEGTFEQVCMNGYRDAPCTIRTYRVIDYLQWPAPYYVITNNLVKNNDILVIGDSISMRTTAYLTLLCHRVTVLDPRYFYQYDYLKDALQQSYDAVLLFPSETLNAGIGGYDAEILAVNKIPQANGTFTLKATVKNTGTMDWCSENNIRMTLWTDDIDVGIRAELESGIVVRPSEQYTFNIYPNDNRIAGHTLSIQMLKEDCFYFGENKEIDRKSIIEDTLDAEILSTTAPVSVDRTDKYAIDITVKNTGTTAWSEQDQIRLTIWQDGYDYGFRVPLPEGKIVYSGETYTFTLEGFVAPQGSVPGDSTELMFWMAQEGVAYFGEQERVVVRVE